MTTLMTSLLTIFLQVPICDGGFPHFFMMIYIESIALHWNDCKQCRSGKYSSEIFRKYGGILLNRNKRTQLCRLSLMPLICKINYAFPIKTFICYRLSPFFLLLKKKKIAARTAGLKYSPPADSRFENFE